MQLGCLRDRHDHAVAARSPGAPYETATRAGKHPKAQSHGKNGALHGDAPADPVRLHEAVPRPRPTRSRVTKRYGRYPRDCVPDPPADCPRVSGPAVTAFRASVAVDDINGTITATDARGRVHRFYRVACAETRHPVSSTSDKDRSGLKE